MIEPLDLDALQALVDAIRSEDDSDAPWTYNADYRRNVLDARNQEVEYIIDRDVGAFLATMRTAAPALIRRVRELEAVIDVALSNLDEAEPGHAEKRLRSALKRLPAEAPAVEREGKS